MTPAGEELALDLLLEAIYRKFHYDFRGYARASLQRRLEHGLQRLGCPSFSALQERLLRDDQTFPALLPFLTVPVSDLFRDPSSFAALRQEIVPLLHTYPFLRFWVAGCSTGEEAYSLAVLLAEEGLLERSLIYATDINQDSLRIAQAGVYSLDRRAGFELNHQQSGASSPLARYYTAGYDRLMFGRELRDRIVFSDHSLATDGVFAEVQLVSCRNVLIYFQDTLKERAIGLFSDALCHGGFLGLGLPETLRFTTREHDFRALPQRWYRKC